MGLGVLEVDREDKKLPAESCEGCGWRSEEDN